jgi:hypothetical protein
MGAAAVGKTACADTAGPAGAAARGLQPVSANRATTRAFVFRWASETGMGRRF